jgi:hypothetical protein
MAGSGSASVTRWRGRVRLGHVENDSDACTRSHGRARRVLTTTLQGAEQDARRIEEKSAYGEGMGGRRKAMVKRPSRNYRFAMRRPALFREPRLLPDKTILPNSSATAAILDPTPIFGAGTVCVTAMSSMPENDWV